MPGSIRNLLCLILLFVPVKLLQGQSATSVTATGHVIAEIIPIFSATETAQMNFGRFAPGPQGGQIILTPESTISVLGSVYAGQGMHSAACFYVSGDNDASFTLTLPTGPVTLNHVSDSRSMRIERLISNTDTGIGSGILHNGFTSVYIGAVLNVGTLEDNPAGIYTGTYSITFDFN